MNEHEQSSTPSMRERELELEVAQLSARLESMQGSAEPADATARMLAMAASTVDQALADARREADELAVEVSAAAEARRDEATRLAAEAEARAAELRAEADQSDAVVAQAKAAADDITTSAQAEARALVEAEREKALKEVQALSEVRAALEQERGALEAYHEELHRRVQELAESMMSFMSTEPPMVGGSQIGGIVVPELATLGIDGDEVAAEPAAAFDSVDESAFASVAFAAETDDHDEPAMADVAVDDVVAEPVADFAAAADHATDSHTNDENTEFDAPVETAEFDAPVETAEFVAPVEDHFDDEMVAEAELVGAEVGFEVESGFDVVTESDIELDAAGAFAAPAAPAAPEAPEAFAAPEAPSVGLFSRATEEEIAGAPDAGTSLFGSHGARLIEQTSPEELASALEDEADDDRFASFLAGDAETDNARDWLLRPEQS